jgi:CheY-like chemotaxis protein
LSKSKILVVDDDKLILDMIKSALEDAGYEVIAKSNGFDALVSLEEEKPALIVADIMMPRLTGLDLLKAIKNNEQTRKIPMILVSAMDQAKSVQDGLDLGAVDYITKPFKVSEIVGKVRHYALASG